MARDLTPFCWRLPSESMAIDRPLELSVTKLNSMVSFIMSLCARSAPDDAEIMAAGNAMPTEQSSPSQVISTRGWEGSVG